MFKSDKMNSKIVAQVHSHLSKNLFPLVCNYIVSKKHPFASNGITFSAFKYNFVDGKRNLDTTTISGSQ